MFRARSEIEKFLAVAEAGKIVAAAHRLGMTQPALTRAIARLESRFGAPLFERLPNGVRPTTLGAVAAREARRLLRTWEEAEDRIGGALAGRTGLIRATADALWMQAVVADATGRFREAFPGIELRMRSAGRGEGLRLLEAGETVEAIGLAASILVTTSVEHRSDRVPRIQRLGHWTPFSTSQRSMGCAGGGPDVITSSVR